MISSSNVSNSSISTAALTNVSDEHDSELRFPKTDNIGSSNIQVALIIFHCRPNSHPFNERQVPLCDPTGVKIGRSVAKAKPDVNNAIFDCKVLSRNHALVWYEDFKFWLRDTKSSNGTFVNSQRLSEGNKESLPRQIFSDDIIQYGVDVVENSNRPGSLNPVTHGCIITQVSLFHPDGREAKRSGDALMAPVSGGICAVGYSQEQMYLLAQYLQEALHREQLLEKKLSRLTQLLASTQTAAEQGWQALLNEERLLSRLELLEGQLLIYEARSSTCATDPISNDYVLSELQVQIRTERLEWESGRARYEERAKESLRVALDEKMQAVQRLTDLERSYESSQEECIHLNKACELAQKELNLLSVRHQQQLQEVELLTEQLDKAKEEHATSLQKVQNEKVALMAKLDEAEREAQQCTALTEAARADCDFSREQLVQLKALVSELKAKSTLEKDGEAVLLLLAQEKKDCDDVDVDIRLKEAAEQVDRLHEKLEEAKSECVKTRNRAAQVENSLELQVELRLHTLLHSALTGVAHQLVESVVQGESSDEVMHLLHQEVSWLESKLAHVQRRREHEEEALQRSVDQLDDQHDDDDDGLALRRLQTLLLRALECQRESQSRLLEYAARVSSLEQSETDAADAARLAACALADARLESQHLREKLESNRCDMLHKGAVKSSLDEEVTLVQEWPSSTPVVLERDELKRLKEECAELGERVQLIEGELRDTQVKKCSVEQNYCELQEKYKALQLEVDSLRVSDEQMGATAAGDSGDVSLSVLAETRTRLHELQQHCDVQEREIKALKLELGRLRKDYLGLAGRSRLVSAGAVLPLMLLLLAVMISLYFTLSGSKGGDAD